MGLQQRLCWLVSAAHSRRRSDRLMGQESNQSIRNGAASQDERETETEALDWLPVWRENSPTFVGRNLEELRAAPEKI